MMDKWHYPEVRRRLLEELPTFARVGWFLKFIKQCYTEINSDCNTRTVIDGQFITYGFYITVLSTVQKAIGFIEEDLVTNRKRSNKDPMRRLMNKLRDRNSFNPSPDRYSSRNLTKPYALLSAAHAAMSTMYSADKRSFGCFIYRASSELALVLDSDYPNEDMYRDYTNIKAVLWASVIDSLLVEESFRLKEPEPLFDRLVDHNETLAYDMVIAVSEYKLPKWLASRISQTSA